MVRIGEGLRGGAIVVDEGWASFEATVGALVDRLVELGELPPALRDRAVSSVLERESMASTAMVDIGVSMPHARIEGLSSPVVTIAASPRFVYERAAGLPISIVALLLSPPAQAGEHLRHLAAIAMLLQSERTRQRLRSARTEEEIVACVRESGAIRS